jgi:hypothetical protein
VEEAKRGSDGSDGGEVGFERGGHEEIGKLLHESATAVDYVSGVVSDLREVLRARLEEVAWMRKKGVYKKITRQEAKRSGVRVVKSRWVGINKGDSVKKN